MADPGAGPFMAITQAAAILLLLIACANIANLLLARGAERSAEYSLRLALGASRARLFGQTLIEGVLLSALAVLLSMPLLAIGLGLSRASLPASVMRFLPGWAFIEIDLRLFTLTALVGMGAMLLFSFVPALQAVRSQVADSLRQSGRTLTAGRNRQWLRRTLATTQMALALALLFASTLALTAADRTINGVLGFDKNNVLVGQLVLPARTYEDPEKRRRFVTGVVDTMRTIPAVSDIGMVSHIPAGFGGQGRRFFPEGKEIAEGEARPVDFRRVTSGYFPALRIPLIRGRWFNDSDRTDSTAVAVVSAAWRTGIGAMMTRSASDSSWRWTAPGSRWSACRATSFTTGSCGRPRPSIARSARMRRSPSRLPFARSAIPRPLAAICAAPSAPWIPISRSPR